MRYIVLPLLLLASPAVAADQFDLACQGTKWTKRGAAGEAYSFRARVDVAAKKWCEGDCKTVQNLVSATDDKIVFTDEGTLNTRMEAAREVTLDRKKGAFIHNFAQIRPDEQILYIAATCKTEGFTPFPAP